jgi:hypothetical protein
MPAVTEVNTNDLAAAIRLGCRTMCNVFNADDNQIPFFRSRVWPEAALDFHWAHSESHVPGRHLNALLNAEDVLALELDEACVELHARAAFFAYSGPVALPLNRQEVGGPLVNFLPHNVREGLHALYALVRFRQSDQALEMGQRSISDIMRLWSPKSGWDEEELERRLGLRVQKSTYIVGLARALGPLVKFYRATRYAPALELALMLAQKALDEFFLPQGDYDRERFGTHTHSTTCVMSSLAQLADLLGDGQLLARVKAFYDHGLWQIRDELGWVIENSRAQANPDLGEVNNTGDIVETALILARWGYSAYYGDAERIVRGHLLPSQLRDVSFVREPANPDPEDGKWKDGRHRVADRHLGAFGFPAPYGHAPLDASEISFNMDIVGGAVASLCEAYRASVRSDETGHWVNLWFDHKSSGIEVESPYGSGQLRVRLAQPAPLFIRKPAWVLDEATSWQGLDAAPSEWNGYWTIAGAPANRWITLTTPLTESTLELAHRTRTIRVRLLGDSVAAMDNFGADLTFFPAFE